jgi:hypothetical protein
LFIDGLSTDSSIAGEMDKGIFQGLPITKKSAGAFDRGIG